MKSPKFTSTPLFPRQALVALLLPLIAEQALSVTIGLADTLMVSSVGEAAVSGVSLVDSFNTLMIQIMSALATGGAVVTSQYIGHQEPKNAKAAAAQILFVLSSFSVLVAAVVIGGRHAILRGIFGSIDADVMHYAETAKNAGLEGSVIIDKIVSANKPNYGFDAQNEVFVEDMIAAGIVDPTKVTRSALENAASVAEMVLTTESLVADLPEPPAPAAPAGGDMGGMY